jgi:hypothetical protein
MGNLGGVTELGYLEKDRVRKGACTFLDYEHRALLYSSPSETPRPLGGPEGQTGFKLPPATELKPQTMTVTLNSSLKLSTTDSPF